MQKKFKKLKLGQTFTYNGIAYMRAECVKMPVLGEASVVSNAMIISGPGKGCHALLPDFAVVGVADACVIAEPELEAELAAGMLGMQESEQSGGCK